MSILDDTDKCVEEFLRSNIIGNISSIFPIQKIHALYRMKLIREKEKQSSGLDNSIDSLTEELAALVGGKAAFKKLTDHGCPEKFI